MLVITGGRRRAGMGDITSALKSFASTVGTAAKQEAAATGRKLLTTAETSLADRLRTLIGGKPGAPKAGGAPSAVSYLPWALGGAAALTVGYLVMRRR